MTKRQYEYREFLKSDFWKSFSNAKKESVGGKCEKCGAKKSLNAHHVVYRNPWTAVRMEDLIVLCRKCHRKAHGIKKPRKSKTQKEFEVTFWFCQDIHQIVNRTVYSGTPMRKGQKKFLRHVAAMFPDNGGVVLRVLRGLEMNRAIVLARENGLRGQDAVSFMVDHLSNNESALTSA